MGRFFILLYVMELLLFLAAAQRAAVAGLVLFVTRQKGRKNAPKGRMPFGFPQCAVAGEINLAARRKSRQLQLLRRCFKEKHRHGSCSDVAFANDVSFCLFPHDRRKLKQKRDSKSFCPANPSWACAYAPKMGEFCWTLPFRRSFFRTADGAVSKGGSLWFPFFRPFFVKRQRKGIFAFTERAQLDGVEVGCARPKEKLLKV